MSKTSKEKADIPVKKVKFNYLLRCLAFGYMFGLAVTAVYFVYMTERYHETLKFKKWIKWSVLGLLALALSFSANVRCTFMLMIPIVCSSKGRAFVITLAYILTISGPVQNFLFNINVLSDSMTCGQRQLRDAVENMLDVVKRPVAAVKSAVKIALHEIENVFKVVAAFLKIIRHRTAQVIRTIKNGFNWLGSSVSMCNKELGTPFDRCYKIADDAIKDCKQKLGAFRALCQVTKIMHGICYSVKFLDVICVLVSFISDDIVKTVQEKLDKFAQMVRDTFYVSIEFEHDFEFTTSVSKNLTHVTKDVFNEIQERTKYIFYVFDFVEIISAFFSILIILKALYYRYRYLKSIRFQNFYITEAFMNLEERRKAIGADMVLPLTWKEFGKYVRISSPFLVRKELWRVAKNMLFLVFSTMQIFWLCYADYALFYILARLYLIGMKSAGLEVEPFVTISVNGTGIVSDVCRGIIHAFEPAKDGYSIDSVSCLPIPFIPDFHRYITIALLIFSAWFFLFVEPLVLRLRIVILNKFYPDRDKERAVWLHSEILMERMSYLKVARRQMRAKFLKNDIQETYKCMDVFRAKMNKYWICRKLCGARSIDNCYMCAIYLGKTENKIRCLTAGCKGQYCGNCFEEISGKCFLCNEPVAYGDNSDFSQEEGSPDEDELREVSIIQSPPTSAVTFTHKSIIYTDNTEISTALESTTDSSTISTSSNDESSSMDPKSSSRGNPNRKVVRKRPAAVSSPTTSDEVTPSESGRERRIRRKKK